MITHTCPTCFKEKELTKVNFEPRKDSKSGFRNQCRDCQKGKTVKVNHLKKCVTCGKVKNNTQEFYRIDNRIINGRPSSKDGLTKKCIECYEQYLYEYRRNPKKKEHRKKYLKTYNVENKDLIKTTRKNWYEKNKESVMYKNTQWRKENPEQYKKTSKEYREKNRSKLSEKGRVWAYQQYQTSEIHRVKNSLRARLRFFTKFKKSLPTSEIIGCSWEYLKQHLENQFQVGMTWENHGRFGWHIDHIIPLSSAQSVEDLHRLNHYTNLKPLWWRDNLTKGSKTK